MNKAVNLILFLAAGFFLFPFFCYAQVNVNLSQYNDEVVQYEKVYSDVIDSVEFERCITYDSKDTTKCLATEPTIKYLYDSKVYATEDVINKNTVKINDNTLKFYSGDTYYQKDGLWTKLEIGYIEKMQYDITNEVKMVSPKEILYNNNPFKVYSVNAQTFSGSGDGSTDCTCTSWTNCVTCASPGNADYTSDEIYFYSEKLATDSYQNKRWFLPFDTSALPDTCTITGADIHLFTGATGVSTVVNVVTTSQASYTEIVNADYADVSDTELCDSDITLTTSNNFSCTLNDNDVISKTGYTPLGVRGVADIHNSSPSDRAYILVRNSEYTGTSNDPYLEITYTEGGGETSSTTQERIEGDWTDELTVITGYTEHYDTSTTTPDWTEKHYYHIPFIVWIIITTISLFIMDRIIIEFLIRWRR